jgi:photosystem II stability/assembly factor-like uncharacterized protein
MSRAASLLLGIAALALAAPARASDAFVDPLDTPSAASPLSARRLLTAVSFAGPRIVAAGQRGHVVYSDDRGRTWAQAEVPVSSDLTALSFPTAQRGWAVGHDGVILATADGGRTWTKELDGRQISPLLSAAMTAKGLADPVREQIAFLAGKGPDLPLLDVWFDDEKSGFAVGAFNLILHTQDGGATWAPWLDRTANPKALHLYSVRRAAGALWIAGEQGLLLKLDPAKQRFVPCATPYPGSFFGVIGDERVVLAFGLRGNVFQSADGGASWRKVETGLEVALTGGARAGEHGLLLASASGQVLSIGDASPTASLVPDTRPLPTSALASDGSTLVMVGMLGARVESFHRGKDEKR